MAKKVFINVGKSRFASVPLHSEEAVKNYIKGHLNIRQRTIDKKKHIKIVDV